MPPYHAIIVGLGAMGSAAACHLARRNLKVLGLEQFSIPHDQGSSHGYSRMIRMAYYEHPHYVPLLRRAYELWHELESQSRQKLLHLTGGLYMGPPTGHVVHGALEAARLHNLPHERLDRADIAKRFPQFHLPDDFAAVLEPQAGFLLPEKVISAHANLALHHGADLHGHEPVLHWQATDTGVTVHTPRETYHAAHLLFCSGAWTSKLLPEFAPLTPSPLDGEGRGEGETSANATAPSASAHNTNPPSPGTPGEGRGEGSASQASGSRSSRPRPIPLTVTRQTLAWVSPKLPHLFAHNTLPVWGIEQPDHSLAYGFPMMPDHPGFKLARHAPGLLTDPDHINRTAQPEDEREIREILKRYLPDADGPLLSLRTCMYTNSPDHHFILDRHPHHKNVLLAAGFSGHGFKFASVIGEILADLAQHNHTPHPIDFLSLHRFTTSST